MSVPYDRFAGAFLSKVSEYSFLNLDIEDRTKVVDGFMKRALASFRKNCRYDLFTTYDDENRIFNIDIPEEDLTELSEIISEGMIVQWLKPYVYKQELLENVLNTRDFSTYSPSELLMRVGNAYNKVQRDYTNMIREYSYNHGDLTGLHI